MRPWLGDELAYAAVSPADSRRARRGRGPAARRALVARIGNLSGAARYRGVRVLVAGPTALAFVGGFLAVGTEPAVRAAIDLEQGDGRALADEPRYRRALAGQPDGALARTPTRRRPACARCSRRATGCPARSARCSTGPA